MFNIAAKLLSLVLVLSWSTPNSAPMPNSPFDQYGAIRWEDEKARLDNFAIQLQNQENLIGHILVVDAVGGCPGEAQARAIRAKRYVVEHRGIATNHLIWRVEGYDQGLSTTLLLAPPEITLSYPLWSTIAGEPGPLNKSCKLKLVRIKKSRW
jgi:hypothetical protein